uniref:PHD-type domain-containing protein n=1 Tax=Setaria italica TaxID=4555 RepID=K3XV77_SETIT
MATAEGSTMEDDPDGAAAADSSSFVLRSGVRAGLKREFAFAIASQAALSEPLGRTRRSSRTLLTTSSPPSDGPKPKRPRPGPSLADPPPPPPPPPPEGETVEQPGPPPPPPPPPPLSTPPPQADTNIVIPPESPPRRITRSMLNHKPPTAAPPPPHNATPLKPKPEPPEEEDDSKPGPALRRFTRSLLLKDKDSNDDDLSGTTTASNASSSPSPNATTSISSSKRNTTNKIPTNLRELLATGLLEGQPVKYIMRKGKRAVLRGVIKRAGILCACSSCKGRKVVSPYYFEVHAGSTKKHPSDYIFLENGNNLHDVLRACTNATLDMVESAIQKAIGPAPHKRTFRCQTCKSSFSTLRSGKFALFCDSCLESKGAKNSTRSSKVARGPTSSAKGYKSASPGAKSASVGRLTRKDKGLHKVVFMSGVLPEGTNVGYFVGGKRLLEGYIKELGIYCHCCDTVVSPSQFEAHAGRAARRKPYHNIYMSNGVSLHELSISLLKGQKTNRQSDDLCSICSDGGQLLLCDTCPRAFHRECVSLFANPKGTWCCRYCENRQQRESCLAYNNNAIAAGRIEGADPLAEIFTRSIRVATSLATGFGGCALCKLHDFSKKKFSTRTVLLCDQCGREYHVGCLKEHNMADLTALPEGAWYCSTDCVRINQKLQDLLNRGGEPVPTMDLDVIKKKREEKGLDEDADLDVRWRVLKDKSSEDSKLVLSKAVAIFHETFDPIIQIATGRDLIPAMVYGRSARDQDYTGMYCAVLTVRNTVVSAGLFRIMGSEIAELPLVATSRDSQGLGYFQALFACIERLLASLEVKHFVLPAAEEAESIWTERFGFTKISQDELHEYLKGGRTTVFQGTSTLHKLVPLPEREC